MSRKSAILRDQSGTTTLEFALTALALMMLLIGICEFGSVCWTWQAIEATANDAARCAGLNAPSCKNASTTPLNTKTYAATAAQNRGFTGITTANVTVSTGTSGQTVCNTTATVVAVGLTYSFNWIFLVPLPSTINVHACYPLKSS
jgi:Flp pilus assembly protein TadG